MSNNGKTPEQEVLAKLFPHPAPHNDSAFAFAGPISWRERAKRILTLIKYLRTEGDVYVVSRRLGGPERYFFVATEKKAKPVGMQGVIEIEVFDTKGNYRAFLPAAYFDGELPDRMSFKGRPYQRAPSMGPGAYCPLQLVEATPRLEAAGNSVVILIRTKYKGEARASLPLVYRGRLPERILFEGELYALQPPINSHVYCPVDVVEAEQVL